MKKLFFLLSLSFFAFAGKAQQYPEMIKVEGGTFTMGAIESNAKPPHTVTVSSFSMGKYEVIVAEYKAFCTATGRTMPTAPTWGWNDKYPMGMLNFDDANAYCNWLSETTGKNYRLPTEAEWEYAAGGGNKSRGYTYSGSDDLEEVGWCNDNADGQTQACGRKKPNELGLYDMSGNAWEWCKDWYSDTYYSNSPSTNPQGPSYSAPVRVLRGGSWGFAAAYCRVTTRYYGSTQRRDIKNGFRVVVPE